MSEFQKFSSAVRERFNRMSKGELFVVDLAGDDVYQSYLAAFPEGTNPIYKERTEHDCSCCKSFIRNIGNVVAIVDGKMQSVWGGLKLAHPYDVVAAALDALVLSASIKSVFRASESSYGAAQTQQMLDDGRVKKWSHFHAKIAKQHFDKGGTVRGAKNTQVETLRRGLEELKPESIAVVQDLIANDSLYRGEEHKKAVDAFAKLQAQYLKLDAKARDIFVWGNLDSQAAFFRNSVIGTLVQDLSADVSLEVAVKSFETKVAPTNYKRPKALITPGMVNEAMKTVGELGLEPSLARRLAKLSDVTINNVLWADNAAKSHMKSGVESLLMAAASKTPPKKAITVEKISIDDFVSGVLPTASSMEILVKNAHQNNLMVLTAPVHDDAAPLFKWNNGFGWSYSGNIADSEIRRAVESRGGRVDGVFRFSHSWNYGKRNCSLMDLHVFMPGHNGHQQGNHDEYGNDQRVGWNHRKHAKSGGVQDVDYTSAAPVGYVPVENITFPSLDKMPEGKYVCKVHNWSFRSPTEGGFRAEIEFDGELYQYEVDRPLKHKEWVSVATVTLKDGVFSIEHHLPCQASTQNVWGIDTETFVPVQTLMNSPNHWDENEIGNKHWFFVLEGCKCDTPMRGIYNEFLRGDLDKHRKVFEVLGDKTKCEPTEDHMAGVGFSSTRKDEVVVRVKSSKGQKTFNITF